MTVLNNQTLADVEIATPTYDRSRLRPGSCISGSAASTAHTRRCTSTPC